MLTESTRSNHTRPGALVREAVREQPHPTAGTSEQERPGCTPRPRTRTPHPRTRTPRPSAPMKRTRGTGNCAATGRAPADERTTVRAPGGGRAAHWHEHEPAALDAAPSDAAPSACVGFRRYITDG